MMKVFLFLTLMIPSLSLAKNYPLSDHYDGKTFFNPEENSLKTFWDILRWKLSGSAVDWPEQIPNRAYPLPQLAPDAKGIVTFINHASFLIQLQGLTIMTDPIYSQRTSPFQFIGPKRVRDPGIEFEMLPPIDVVIISHNHYDHLDLETIKSLDKKFHPLFIVPLGDEGLLKSAGVQNVMEMDWWQEFKIKDTIIIFTPSQHWSSRTMFDKCESLWGSYMINSPRTKIYFAGDTGYASHFRQIKTRIGAPDLSLLPIGAYLPRDIMRVNHLNPEEAVKAHIDLGSALSLGMHFGTFQLTDEGYDDPVKGLEAARKKVGIFDETFRVLDQGESLTL